MKDSLKLFWLGSIISFFIFFQYFRSLTNAWNRLELAWHRIDTLLIVILLIMGGIMLGGGFHLSRSLIKKKVWRHQLFLVFLFVIAWPLLDSLIACLTHPALKKGANILAIFLTCASGFYIIKYPEKTMRVMIASLLIISPVIPLFLLNTLLYNPVSVVAGTFPDKKILSANNSPPVFVFLFDEWSYRRTFEKGEPLPGFNHLQDFASRSIVYHQAFSPGNTTNNSLPPLLGEPVMSHQTMIINNSLFESGRKMGWESFIVGAYLPYAFWMEPWTEYAQQFPNYRRPTRGFWDGMMMHASLGLLYPVSFWNEGLGQRWFNLRATVLQKERIPAMHQSVLRLLRYGGNKMLYFIHYSIPHEPYVYPAREDGSEASAREDIIRQYTGNIRYVDLLLGQLMDSLQANKLREKSLIIITSDHAWKSDPILQQIESLEELEGEKRHVPLLIKMPFQKRRINVTALTPTLSLKPFLNNVFQNDFKLKKIVFRNGKIELG